MESGLPIVVVTIRKSPDARTTNVASGIAESLRCTLICLDDIFPKLTRSSKENVEEYIKIGYDMVCAIATTQLRLGQSVVIDSLSSVSEFSQLNPLYDSKYLSWGNAFVIVECYSSDPWFEKRPRYLDDSTDLPAGVSIMGVNTFLSADYDKVAEALTDLTYCYKGRHVVEFHDWKPFHYNETNGEQHVITCDGKRLAATKKMSRQPYSNFAHALTEFKQVRHRSYCGACQEQASTDAAYACWCGCRVVLHRECQRLSEDETHHNTPKSLSQLLRLRLLGGYLFPDPRKCKLCRATEREFSYECQRCLFETLLKCGWTPFILNDLRYKFVLQARSFPSIEAYRCDACGKPGSCAGYSCFHCNKHYHVGCVFMPLSLPHEHGGWKHQMDLQFKSAEDEEGTFCDFCYKDLDPNFWFYKCKEGCYLTHIECVFSEWYDEEGREHINGKEVPEALEKQDHHFCNGNHILTYSKYEAQGESYIATCRACEKPILGAMYTCEHCCLILHESCATIAEKLEKYPNERLCEFLDPPVGYSFLGSHRCSFCAENPQKYISYECGNCIFEANLKHKKWPAVIHHNSHEHHLSFWAMPLPQIGRFHCNFCEKPGSFISYDSVENKDIRTHIHCLIF